MDNLLYLNWQEGFKLVKAEQVSLETAFFNGLQEEEAELQNLLNTDREEALKVITAKVQERADKNVLTYRSLRKTLLTKFTNNRQGINFQ